METNTIESDWDAGDGGSVIDYLSDLERLDEIDFEREFGAYDVACIFTSVQFIHDYFVGFYNFLTDKVPRTGPIATVFVPDRLQQKIMKETRDHSRKSSISAFYSLSYNAFILLCQVVYQASYALVHNDYQLLAVLDHQCAFVFLLHCIYYGVEHYMLVLPAKVQHIPACALRLCFTRALNKLGEDIAKRTEPIVPYKQHTLNVPCGANMLEIKYYAEGAIDKHRGCPYDTQKSYTLSAEITVHTFEMYPVVRSDSRGSYKNSRLQGNTIVDELVLPERRHA